MSRTIRPYLPGVPFHLTARLQNREPLFIGLQAHIARLIMEAADVGRVSVVAYAVMPNHLHMLVIQGDRPLARYMQPLLRRAALLVMKHWGREGHMFERRYHATACLDADHFRNAIGYIHLNPIRAGLCRAVDDYEWTSHRQFRLAISAMPTGHQLAVASALRVFAERDSEAAVSCCDAYDRFLIARRAIDAHGAGDVGYLGPQLPFCRSGDAWWHATLGRRAGAAARDDALRRFPRVQLRDIAEQVLTDHAPDMGLRTLRSGSRSRPVVHVRRIMIGRALHAGFVNQQIARYLDVSGTTVSSVACATRPHGG